MAYSPTIQTGLTQDFNAVIAATNTYVIDVRGGQLRRQSFHAQRKAIAGVRRFVGGLRRDELTVEGAPTSLYFLGTNGAAVLRYATEAQQSAYPACGPGAYCEFVTGDFGGHSTGYQAMSYPSAYCDTFEIKFDFEQDVTISAHYLDIHATELTTAPTYALYDGTALFPWYDNCVILNGNASYTRNMTIRVKNNLSIEGSLDPTSAPAPVDSRYGQFIKYGDEEVEAEFTILDQPGLSLVQEGLTVVTGTAYMTNATGSATFDLGNTEANVGLLVDEISDPYQADDGFILRDVKCIGQPNGYQNLTITTASGS